MQQEGKPDSGIGVFDVAECILDEQGPMSPLKLMHLVYYSQAWAVVNHGPIFGAPIEAWRRGAFERKLWSATCFMEKVCEMPLGDPDRIPDRHYAVILAVLRTYGEKSGVWLSALAHREDPWQEAYEIGPESVITHESMKAFYSSI